MQRVTLKAGGRYEAVIGAGVIDQAPRVLGRRARIAVVTQALVAGHHGDTLRRSLDDTDATVEFFEISEGEEAKSLRCVEDLCGRWARGGLSRRDAVVGLGGGVVGDVAGFAAAVYHRGVDVLHIPTTLLAQVDSSIGGKTGVNLREGKNLVGAFHQPVGVLADIDTLATLPTSDFRSGLGEVAKYAFLGGSDAQDVATILDYEHDAVLSRDPQLLERLVGACVAIKAAVVDADEREATGGRAVLNYGHTLGHALEANGGYTLRHGEAVATGLVFAAELAHAMGRIDAIGVERHRRLVASLGLPTEVPEGAEAPALIAHMRRDKKAAGGLTFVLDGPAGPELVSDPPHEAMARALVAVGVRAGGSGVRG